MMIVMIIDHYRIGAISARVSHYNGGSKKCPLDQGSESIKHIQSIDLQSTSTLTDISLSLILKETRPLLCISHQNRYLCKNCLFISKHQAVDKFGDVFRSNITYCVAPLFLFPFPLMLYLAHLIHLVLYLTLF